MIRRKPSPFTSKSLKWCTLRFPVPGNLKVYPAVSLVVFKLGMWLNKESIKVAHQEIVECVCRTLLQHCKTLRTLSGKKISTCRPEMMEVYQNALAGAFHFLVTLDSKQTNWQINAKANFPSQIPWVFFGNIRSRSNLGKLDHVKTGLVSREETNIKLGNSSWSP